MALTKVPSNLDATVATTQSASDNSTNVATTAYVTTALSNLVDSSPSALNTLNELAAALNDDASFSTTVNNSIATKLPLAGGTMTGALNMGSQDITNLDTLASTHFSSSANINSSGDGGLFIPNGKRLGFDQSGTRSWTQYAAGGNLLFASGDGNGAIQANNFTGVTLTLSGAISSGAITSSASLKATDYRVNEGNSLAGGLFKEKNVTGSGSSNDLSIFAEGISNGGNIHFMTGGSATARATIDSSGNVGIGTTSPASLLDLRKTTAGSITGGSGNKGAVLTLHHEAQWENGYTGGDWLGAIDFSTGDGSAGEGIRASIRATSDNYYNTNSLAFYTADQGDTTLDLRMIIKNDGEVGIGRLPENAKVHILGNSSYVGNHGYSTLCLEDTSGYAGLNLRNGNNQWLIRNDGSSNALQIVNSSNASGPGVGSHSNRFEIEAGGDVKVGATGSGNAYKLEVYDGDYTTMMLRGPTYPMLKFKADNQNSGNNGSISIGSAGAIYMNPNNSTTGIYVGYDGVFNASSRQYYHAPYGEHHVRTGGAHGTGTYTLFTNGSSSTQSAGIVEVWGIYGTPSGASYRMYVISGNRSIVTAVAHTQTNSVPIPVLAWSGANLQISNSNGSLYYHVRVTLQDIGISWAPTWGNFPGIN